MRTSTAARSSRWLATKASVSATRARIGEDVVPGGDRVQRDPVGGRLEVGAGGPQPRAGGGDALGGRAEIEQRLV